ncbi:MAG: aminotransferase class III-fold pyridoxal phosphate-dependent enzyme [Myxococcota bacterium]|nr:aminotransferase class III-fold pyridoxal phosphate-dependent enzyme [Myxococcota bacterium]
MSVELSPFNDSLPELTGAIPGPASRALAGRLANVENRNVTCLQPEVPIFWERAGGANVWDVDGNRYLDLTAAFGVASTGHAHPQVVAAIANQAESLLHGMGDVHPSRAKVELLEALASRYPGGVAAKTVLGCSGADAVEAALKTALMATGRAGVVAFEGGYHGLSLGALDTTARTDFRQPFGDRLAHATGFAPYGDIEGVVETARELQERGHPVGAVLVEPVQGRGGERVPPKGFLQDLRQACDRAGWLLIADEIYTGCGRTGRFFACEHEGVVPDLLCVGKGLAAGMPISACMGRVEVMDRWPVSQGEALHTQTFLGHPASCAAALAALRTIDQEGLVERAERYGLALLQRLRKACEAFEGVAEVRGLGMMIGIECTTPERAQRVTRRVLEGGVIVLPSGPEGRVISLTPPLCIGPQQLDLGARVLIEELRREEGTPR